MAEGGAGGGGFLVENTAAADGEVEPLVGVERNGVGFGYAVEEMARGGESGKAAVSGVDVEPEALTANETGEVANGIDGAGGGGTGAGDDAEGEPAGAAVFVDEAVEVGEVHLETVIHADVTDVCLAEAEHGGGLGNREVSFPGDVQAHGFADGGDTVADHVYRSLGAARSREGSKIRHGPAAGIGPIAPAG